MLALGGAAGAFEPAAAGFGAGAFCAGGAAALVS